MAKRTALLGWLLWMQKACLCDPWTLPTVDDGLKACTVPSLDEIGEQPTSFYECAESVLRCGENGYFQRYGIKYANRYHKDLKPNLAETGKQFVDKVTYCQQYFLRSRLREHTPCSQVPSIVDEFAGTCHISSGACDITLVESLLWAESFDWEDLPVMSFTETAHGLYFQCSSPVNGSRTGSLGLFYG